MCVYVCACMHAHVCACGVCVCVCVCVCMCMCAYVCLHARMPRPQKKPNKHLTCQTAEKVIFLFHVALHQVFDGCQHSGVLWRCWLLDGLSCFYCNQTGNLEGGAISLLPFLHLPCGDDDEVMLNVLRCQLTY